MLPTDNYSWRNVMLPYFILIAIPTLFGFVCLRKSKENSCNRRLFLATTNKEDNLLLPAFFLILTIMLICRSESVGSDTSNYRHIFENISSYNISMVFSNWKEVLFVFINYGVGKVTSSFRIFLLLVSLLSILPIAWLYCQNRRHGYLKMILYVNMSTFVMIFSGIRQSIAIAFGVLAFICLEKGKRLAFIICAIVASLIHTSGFMVFLLFPLYYCRIKKKHLFIVVPIMGMIYVFNRQIFGYLVQIVSSVYGNYDSQMTSTGAFGSLILFFALSVFTCMVSDEKKMDKEAYALRNILFFVVALQCFAPLHSLAMRLNYYFIVFVPVAVAKGLESANKKYKQIVDVGEVVLCVFFSAYFVYSVFRASTHGGLLNTVPYVSFFSSGGY